jgi:hypothetical protein
MRLPAAALRYLGAAALLAVGADHLDQLVAEHYSAIPTIGTLFVLNVVAATTVAAGLAAPVERLAGRGAVAVLAAAGVVIAGGSLVGLLVSESWSLFGFVESGYRAGIVVAIALDGATILLLGAFLAWPGLHRSTIVGRTCQRRTSHRRSPTPSSRSWTRSGSGARPPSAT